MADFRPFRALRYDPGRAGSLASLVAPPFDVISDAERKELLARSPYNVVHLTLPESEDRAARAFAGWLESGVLVREPAHAFWALQQDYVGPDGVARTRSGVVGALRVEPYSRQIVLPHERTHRGPKEGRLRLLRALRVELEPIFLLYEDERPFAVPEVTPDFEVEGTRLWRLAEDVGAAFANTQLLIADGHHRYETALAFHEEEGSEATGYMLAVLVSTTDPGLTIFPTHRLAAQVNGLPPGDRAASVVEALDRLRERPYDRAACVAYAGGRAELVVGESGELDPALVERLVTGDVTYTPDATAAIRAVDEGQAAAAFLLRPTRIEDVFAVAQRGDTMPQKSTYFYPKVVSGLLFQPLD